MQVYTREYVSPEVAQALVGGAASIVAQPSWDLWGIGIIMWEMATGAPTNRRNCTMTLQFKRVTLMND
jgi:serine/threonine protein kinase